MFNDRYGGADVATTILKLACSEVRIRVFPFHHLFEDCSRAMDEASQLGAAMRRMARA